MSEMNMSEQILLEKCRDIELLCKELYEYFAEIYSDNESASSLWSKTSKEEENHAAQFTLALRLRKSLPCMVVIDAARVESVLFQLRSVIVRVKAAPPKLVDALCSAVKLERCLADFHLNCVAIFEDDSYRKMFNAMMAHDQNHIESLQNAYDFFVGSKT